MDVPVSIAPIGTDYHLRALWKDDAYDVTQLYVVDAGYDWRFLENANDINGNSLHADRNATNVEFGLCYEHVLVELMPDYLEARRKSGLSIKVWGRAGEQIVEVPAFYVDGFLRKVDEYRASTSGAVAGNSAP